MTLKLLLLVLSCFKLNASLIKTRYYPRYHLAPIKGWMNDPNGFCMFNGVYHLFYQHNPVSSLEPGTARWRHVTSKDLFHWIDSGIALQNDTAYDKDGVFSGSAVIDGGVMYLFYTGHVKLPSQTPDQNETQALATSNDGIHFTKYEHNPIISRKDLLPNIRDPKVWKHGRYWYMVIGNSFNSQNGRQLGRILLFRSSNKINWIQVSVLAESDGFLGYMWECPDFFELNGYFILLFSPQGIKAQGDRYRNLYQTGYIIGYFDYTTNIFNPITQFTEIDNGHDFYATQTILDAYGRRLLVAWMDMWERSYPEGMDGFSGQMTIIRTLTLNEDFRIIQKPVKEVVFLREKVLYNGRPNGDITVTLPNKAGEVFIKASNKQDFTLLIGSNATSVQIKYEYLKGRVSLRREKSDDGLRRTKYRPFTNLTMRIFIDASSIELFCGEGEVTMSSRFFIDDTISVSLSNGSKADLFTVYAMKTTLYNSS